MRVSEATKDLSKILFQVAGSGDFNWDYESSSFLSKKKDIYVSFYDKDANSNCMTEEGDLDLSFEPFQMNVDIVGLKGGYSSISLKEQDIKGIYVGRGKLDIFLYNGSIVEYLLW